MNTVRHPAGEERAGTIAMTARDAGPARTIWGPWLLAALTVASSVVVQAGEPPAGGVGTPARHEAAAPSAGAGAAQAPRAATDPARIDSALGRFGDLLGVYRPGGQPLQIRTTEPGDAARLSDAPTDAKRPAEMIALVRSATGRIGRQVTPLPSGAQSAPAVDVSGAKRPGDPTDLMIVVSVTEADRTAATAEHHAGRGSPDLWLHLNLVDVARQAMIPKMQASGALWLEPEAAQGRSKFLLRGASYAVMSDDSQLPATRTPASLLADLSVLELLGRYTLVPYWRCIPGAKPDGVVLREVEKRFLALDKPTRVRWLRETLVKYGFPLPSGNALDEPTRVAIDELIAKFNFRRPSDYLDPGLFVDLYVNVPLQAHSATAPRGNPA